MKRAERSAQAKRDAKMRQERVSDVTRATKHVKSINDASETFGARTDDVSVLSDDDSDDDALY